MEYLIPLACILALAYTVHQFRYALEAMERQASTSADVAARSVSALAQVKGLDPHRSDPKTFAPGGRSWDAVEQERVEVVSSAMQAKKDARRRELEDAIKYFRLQDNDERVAQLQLELEEIA